MPELKREQWTSENWGGEKESKGQIRNSEGSWG